MTTQTTLPQPGDVVNGHQLSEDGTTWVPVTGAPVPPAVEAKKSGKGKKIAAGIGAGVIALIAFNAIGGGNASESSDTTTPEAAVEAPADPAPAQEAKAPEAPEMTVSQENAVEKAESYLEFSGFSRSGLIDQLEFEGFSTEDATFAVDHLESTGAVDWNAEAVEKAESYMEFSAFSRSGLIDQLEFEGFTTEQANYAADQVGL